MEILNIRENMYVLDEGGVRSFLFTGSDGSLLVDSGFGKSDLAARVKELTSGPVSLLLTHADMDHTGDAAHFDDVYLHEEEKPRYRARGGQALHMLRDGDAVPAGSRTLEVIHLPGHTPGFIALLCREERFLIGGDSVQGGPVFMFGEGRDFDRYIASMDRLKGFKELYDTVYASHGELTAPEGVEEDLKKLAISIRAGEAQGTKPPFDMPCLLYSLGQAKMLA